jgi:CBS domain-containing protein/sporulation protein YlmC with PRC-barrel domain
MVLFTEMFVSQTIGIPVVDKVQESIGNVKDIIITLGEVFPKVTGLLVRKRHNKKENAVVLMDEIELVGKQFVSTKKISSQTVFTGLRANEVLLKRDLLDKQIVDTEGARIIRINDLKLSKVNEDIRLTAVDVGLTGILRRLGIEKLFASIFSLFKKKLPEKLIGWDHVEQFKTDLFKGKIAIPHRRLEELHPADIAYVISQVHQAEKSAIIEALSEATAAEAIHELEPMIGAMLMQSLDTKKALTILEKMPSDEAADLLGDIPEERRNNLLRLIKVRKAEKIKKLLTHKDETAGGLMTTEFITLKEDISVQDAIELLRSLAPSAETIYYLYVTNHNEQFVGVLSLRELIISSPEKSISEIMHKEDLLTATPDMKQKQVAELISKYNLLAVPVIDQTNKILGIITVDDVIDFILPPVSRRKRQMIG